MLIIPEPIEIRPGPVPATFVISSEQGRYHRQSGEEAGLGNLARAGQPTPAWNVTRQPGWY